MSIHLPRYDITVPSENTEFRNLGKELRELGESVDAALASFDYNGADPNLVLSRVAALEIDTGWLPFTMPNWITRAGSGPAARLLRGVVYLRGVVSNDTHTGGFTTYGKLPDGIPAPSGAYVTSDIAMNTTVTVRCRVDVNGNVQIYREAISSTWVNLASLSYPIG